MEQEVVDSFRTHASEWMVECAAWLMLDSYLREGCEGFLKRKEQNKQLMAKLPNTLSQAARESLLLLSTDFLCCLFNAHSGEAPNDESGKTEMEQSLVLFRNIMAFWDKSRYSEAIILKWEILRQAVYQCCETGMFDVADRICKRENLEELLNEVSDRIKLIIEEILIVAKARDPLHPLIKGAPFLNLVESLYPVFEEVYNSVSRPVLLTMYMNLQNADFSVDPFRIVSSVEYDEGSQPHLLVTHNSSSFHEKAAPANGCIAIINDAIDQQNLQELHSVHDDAENSCQKLSQNEDSCSAVLTNDCIAVVKDEIDQQSLQNVHSDHDYAANGCQKLSQNEDSYSIGDLAANLESEHFLTIELPDSQTIINPLGLDKQISQQVHKDHEQSKDIFHNGKDFIEEPNIHPNNTVPHSETSVKDGLHNTFEGEINISGSEQTTRATVENEMEHMLYSFRTFPRKITQQAIESMQTETGLTFSAEEIVNEITEQFKSMGVYYELSAKLKAYELPLLQITCTRAEDDHLSSQKVRASIISQLQELQRDQRAEMNIPEPSEGNEHVAQNRISLENTDHAEPLQKTPAVSLRFRKQMTSSMEALTPPSHLPEMHITPACFPKNYHKIYRNVINEPDKIPEKRREGPGRKGIPWTPIEMDLLYAGVVKYGLCKWSFIRNEYFLEYDRTAYDLSDKWRNINHNPALLEELRRKWEEPIIRQNVKLTKDLSPKTNEIHNSLHKSPVKVKKGKHAESKPSRKKAELEIPVRKSRRLRNRKKTHVYSGEEGDK